MSVRNIILRGASSGGIGIAFFSFLYAVSKNLYNRYSKVPKLGERVVVLGASSGIGRSIARQYAERGARVCIVGRREALVNEVVAECQGVRNMLSSDKQENIFGIAADFANVDDMIRTRTIVEASKVQAFTRVRLSQLIYETFRMERI
jgi:NADP-dependent 3-hydroxy acid dehydrogenase YdfG